MAEKETDETVVVDDENVDAGKDEKAHEELSDAERLKKLEEENETLRRENELAGREKSGLNKTITGLKEKIGEIETEGKTEQEKLVLNLQRENEELKTERNRNDALTIERDAIKAFAEEGIPVKWLDLVKIDSVEDIPDTIVKIKAIIEDAQTSGKKALQENLGLKPEGGGDGGNPPDVNPFTITDPKKKLAAMTALHRSNPDLYEKYKREAKK